MRRPCAFLASAPVSTVVLADLDARPRRAASCSVLRAALGLRQWRLCWPCYLRGRELRRRFVRLGLVGALLAVLFLAGCARPPSVGWTVAGDAPAAFVAEVDAAAPLAAEVAGWRGPFGGTVLVRPGPFACHVGRCAGLYTSGLLLVEVAVAPELGLGPAVGTTALEHELCHAAGIVAEDAASRCAAEVVRRLGEGVPHA